MTPETHMTPIAQAVAPLKADAEERARAAARTLIDKTWGELEAVGWNADAVAPAPHGRMDRATYKQAQARRAFVMSITVSATPTIRHGDPHVRLASEDAAARFVASCVADAAASFDAFVAKLQQKVGDHSAARMVVDGSWSYSVVEVETPAGTQRWKTQQIINVSGLGTVFNQWPTRLMK